MKRHLLTLTLPALFASFSASAIDISNTADTKFDMYGRINATNSVLDHDNPSIISARLGINGEKQFIFNTSFYGRFEWETSGISLDNAVIDNRYGYAGFASKYNGSIDYGKNDGVLKSILNYTDYSEILPNLGGDMGKYTLLGNRTASVLTYTNHNLFGRIKGLTFAAQYADKKSKKMDYTPDTATGINYVEDIAYGVRAEYAILNTGITIGAGYVLSPVDYETDEHLEPFKERSSAVLGIKYDAHNVYLGATYRQTRIEYEPERDINNFTKSYNGYEFIAQYGLEFDIGRITPMVSYVYDQLEDRTVTDLARYVAVGIKYDLNSHITALADYKINLLKVGENGVTEQTNTSNQMGLGLIYNF